MPRGKQVQSLAEVGHDLRVLDVKQIRNLRIAENLRVTLEGENAFLLVHGKDTSHEGLALIGELANLRLEDFDFRRCGGGGGGSSVLFHAQKVMHGVKNHKKNLHKNENKFIKKMRHLMPVGTVPAKVHAKIN
jgi:hypothetical protein